MGEIPKKMLVTSDLEKNLIFQNIMKSKEPLKLTINEIEYTGHIKKIYENSLTVKMNSPFIGDLEGNITTNFTYHNNYHYFSAQAHQMDETTLQLAIPEKINKNMMRRFVRIDISGKVFMKIKIMIQSQRHELKTSSILDERVIFQEVKKPQPAVDKILKGIKHLVSEYSQRFQLKVFKPGQALNFPESILKETKKIFLIYDSYEDGLEEKRFSEDEIICIHDVYEYLVARGEQRKVTEGKLLDFLQQTRNRRIFSECYVPLMLEGEVAGYIRLLNDIDYHRSIKPAFALRTVAYADILVEALVKYDYFRLESGKNHEISVLNISAGGLLFRLDDERLKKYIIVNTVIQMSILLPGRSIEARGIVYRIETKRSEYGAKFQEINETDMKYIDDLANKRIQLS